MYDLNIPAKLNGKKILIWGYGREGKSTERFIKSHCPDSNISIFEGTGENIDFAAYDIVLKSPGINTAVKNEKITSQTELFLSQFGKQTIGITGTKGKSTTSTLLYTVLSSLKIKKAILVGNIGLPCLDYYDEIDENTVIVFELSCHQLNDSKYSPHIAIFLNLFEDHLDYYITRENYFKAKANIATHQNENDFLYYGPSVPTIDTKSNSVLLTDVEKDKFDIPLLGKHNQYNANVVYTVCAEHFGMSDEAIRSEFVKFHGLPHRMEHIGKVNGVDYYDDSISTIPEATIQALQSVPNAYTVIIGGMDRNIDYGVLIDYIKKHQEIRYILAYSSGERIFKSVRGLSCCVYVKDLYAAVREAKKSTPAGCACVLSPAAASYGYFKNFEERGDKFKELVLGKSSVLFTGDISFDKYMAGKWDEPELLSDEVTSFIKDTDHVVANVEGPLMDVPVDEKSEGAAQLKHCMSGKVASFLKDIGADIWTLCNNHIMDAGTEGLRSTLELAAAYGINTLGVGMDIHDAEKPVILDEAGGIGIITVGYQRACRPAGENTPGCYRWDSMDDIAQSIKSIKDKCRWCVVVSHGGEEFTPLPSPYTRDRYLNYLEMGADIVVSHHPHVPMNYETVGEKTIFYSLGNFIFDTDYQRSQHYTENGILLKLNFTEQDYSFEAMGIKVIRGKEQIVKSALPNIFEDVSEEDYKLLLPLSVKAFIEATKRQLIFLKPDEFNYATEEKWNDNFMQPMRSGRVPGEVLDMQILCPIAAEAEKGDWKKSKHKKIVDYILHQMEPVG